MTPQTAANAAERNCAQSDENLSDGERRLIAQAATLRPDEGHRIIEAMCALGAVSKLMVRGS